MRSVWVGALGAPAVVPHLLEALLEASQPVDAPAGTLLLSAHEDASHLVVLVRGDASVGTLQPAPAHGGSTFLTERSLSAPAWIDASSAWRGGQYLHDVQTTSDSLAMRLPIGVARRLAMAHPEFAIRMLKVLAEQIDQLGIATRDLLHKDAEARFAVWLVQRLPEMSPDANAAVIVLAERKRDIAAQLGITPETLSRLQRSLTRKGLIDVVGYSVRILDVTALRRLAGT